MASLPRGIFPGRDAIPAPWVSTSPMQGHAQAKDRLGALFQGTGEKNRTSMATSLGSFRKIGRGKPPRSIPNQSPSMANQSGRISLKCSRRGYAADFRYGNREPGGKNTTQYFTRDIPAYPQSPTAPKPQQSPKQTCPGQHSKKIGIEHGGLAVPSSLVRAPCSFKQRAANFCSRAQLSHFSNASLNIIAYICQM
jgi:hypothetical protein